MAPYKLTNCEVCYNNKCSQHGKRVMEHYCSSWVDPDPKEEAPDEMVTQEYEAPDYRSIFPPGWSPFMRTYDFGKTWKVTL